MNGNLKAGKGELGHVVGTSIFYLRGRRGARLFYRKVGENEYEIVGKSSKANENEVMNKVREIYGKG